MRYVATLRDFKGPPWKTDSELAVIRDWFYPQRAKYDVYSGPQPDMRKRAISKVNLYLFKAGDIPHAITSTANLTEAILHDSQENRSSHISDSAMISIYAMALVKFVNGFVDRDVAKAASVSLAGQQTENSEEGEDTAQAVKGGGESSMYAHAARIGMPEGFVDLRHEIVHGRIPALQLLRGRTWEGLEWLWEKWWVKHATGDPDQALNEMELRQKEIADVLSAQEVTEEGTGVGA
jgi:hypothetical protein